MKKRKLNKKDWQTLEDCVIHTLASIRSGKLSFSNARTKQKLLGCLEELLPQLDFNYQLAKKI